MNFHFSVNATYLNPDRKLRCDAVCQSIPAPELQPFLLSAQVGDQVFFPIDQLELLVAKREWIVRAGATTLCVWLGERDSLLPENDSDDS